MAEQDEGTESKLRYMEACDRIREDILGGTFAFGSHLKIADLAERYRTSHMPIREALRLLNGEGLVQIEPHRGVRVRRFDRAFVENLFDIRLVIEEMQCRRAAARRTPEHLEELHAARMAFEAIAEQGDTRGLLESNRRFHAAISAAAGNSEAETIELRHWRLLPTLWKAFGYPHTRVPVVVDDHRHIETAIRKGDADGAAILAAAHCLKAKNDMLDSMERNRPEPPSAAKPAARRRVKSSTS